MIARALLRTGALRCAGTPTRIPPAGTQVARALSTELDKSTKLSGEVQKVTSVNELKRPGINELFSDVDDSSIKSELARIRVMEDEAIASLTDDVPEIDWDEWRKKIRYPGLVDEMKASYDATTIPDMEDERKRLTEAVHNAFEPILQSLKDLAADAEKSGAQVEEELANVRYMRENFKDLTVDEFLERYPSIKKTIESDIANNRWFVD